MGLTHPNFFWLLAFNAFLAYFTNLTNFLVTRYTSALTLQVRPMLQKCSFPTATVCALQRELAAYRAVFHPISTPQVSLAAFTCMPGCRSAAACCAQATQGAPIIVYHPFFCNWSRLCACRCWATRRAC